jgi:cytochrome c5
MPRHRRRGAVTLALAAGFAPVPGCGPDAEPAVVARYEAHCAACHEAGAANAPLTHDEDAWALRVPRGVDEMLTAVVKGTAATPARGTCVDCSDQELTAIIAFMVE